MYEPDWFVLLEAWTKRGMGSRGPTLAYLVGALARAKQFPCSADGVRKLLEDMAYRPVPGYIVQVSWCSTIGDAVLSLYQATIPTSHQRWYRRTAKPVERPPLEFSGELLTEHGLGCSNPEDGMRKLAEEAMVHIEKGAFSRTRQRSGLYDYGPFTERELEFIDGVFATSSGEMPT